jgi:hypothetical protein
LLFLQLMSRLTFLFFVLTVSLHLQAQDYQLSGKITDTQTGVAIPFAQFFVEKEKLAYFSDQDGLFQIPLSSTDSRIFVKHLFYENDTISIKEDNFLYSLNIKLSPKNDFPYARKTPNETAAFVQKILDHKPLNNPEQYGDIAYRTYNKLTVQMDNIETLKIKVNEILRFLDFEIREFTPEHHIFLMEATTTRTFLNKLNQKEEIYGSKVSGIEVPNVYTISALLQPLNVYSDLISILNTRFLSPFNSLALNNYAFSLVETIASNEEETLYLIKFNPLSRWGEMLHGFAYISSKNYAVKYIVCEVAFEQRGPRFYQSYTFLPHGRWFTDRTKTETVTEDFFGTNETMVLKSETFIDSVQFNNHFTKKNFDEVIREYKNSLYTAENTKWKQYRAIPLSEKDVNTYRFYDTIGTIRHFERIIRFGESYYFGEVPIRKFNIENHRIASFNRHEGLRIGFGGHTNNDFSTDYWLGGFIGLGLGDTELKYGASAGMLLFDPIHLTMNAELSKDLHEAARENFPFYEPQYYSEYLRNLRVFIMDMVYQGRFSLQANPFRYMFMQTDLSRQVVVPTYAYQFRDLPTNAFNYAEWRLGLKYAFGEKFITSFHHRFSTGSCYPFLWVNYTMGRNLDFMNRLNFDKIDLRVEQRLWFIEHGEATYQFNAGWVVGEAPYPKLYNMKGSFEEPSVVVRNSFETMQYHEFIADRYFTLFYAHRFGSRVISQRFNMRPYPEFFHNMGIGWLMNPENHQLINFRTMQRGYFESGLILNDIFIIRLAGLGVGLGGGLFFRYGPYAMDRMRENLVFKFALEFKL